MEEFSAGLIALPRVLHSCSSVPLRIEFYSPELTLVYERFGEMNPHRATGDDHRGISC